MPQERSLRLGIDSTGAKRGAREVVKSLDDIRRAANRTVDEVDRIEHEFRGLNRAAESLQSVGRRLTMFVTLPLIGLAGFSVKAAAEMESLELALTALTGSSKEATDQLERLKVVAAAPGLGFKEAAQGSITLQAVGLAATHAERAMKALGNAIALTGGGKSELERVVYQLGQMAALGRVSSLDLRPIIQTAPAIAKALNELFGSTSAEKIAEQTKDFDEFFNLLIPHLEKMPSVAGGARNTLDNLADSAFRARAALGEHLLPALLPLITGVADLLEQVEELDGETVRFGISVAATAALLGPAALAVAGLTSAVSLLAIALGTALLPLLVAGGAVTVALAVLGQRFFENKLDALAAKGAVDEYTASLAGLSRQELVGEAVKLDVRIGRLERMPQTEFIRGVIAGLYDDAAKIGEALGALPGDIDTNVRTPLGNAADEAKKLKRLLEEAADGFLDRWKSLDIAQSAAEFSRAFQTDVRGPIVSDAEMGAFGRGRDSAGRPGQISETLVQNSGVQQGRIDAARIRELERKHAEADKAGDSLVRTASDVSRGVIDVADAFGGLDDATRRLLSGITGLISSADSFDPTKALSSLANIGSIAGMIGAGVQVASGLIGMLQKNDESERERAELLSRNNDALLSLAEKLSDFSLTANALFGGRASVGAAIGAARGRDSFAALDAAKAGAILPTLRALANEFGIDLFDDEGRIVADALHQLNAAIGMSIDSLVGFGNSLAEQRNMMSAFNEIFDLDADPQRALDDAYALLGNLAPDLLRQFGLANLSLDSEAGRNVLEQGLRDLFIAFRDKSIDPALLGDLTGSDFIDLLLQADKGLDAFTKGLNDAAQATTDIPKAINLALYQQRYATGPNGPAAPGGPLDTGPSIPGGGAPITGQAYPGGGANFYITIQGSSLTGEQLLDEVERAAQQRVGSGGEVVLS